MLAVGAMRNPTVTIHKGGSERYCQQIFGLGLKFTGVKSTSVFHCI